MQQSYRFIFAVGIAIATVCAFAQDSCVPTIRSAGTFQIDLSIPGRFVDVCAEDAALCRTLTSGYPASVSTLAYFVLPEEWKATKENPRGFKRYLIAQLLASMTPDKLPGFKQYLHSQQGQVPDHTTLIDRVETVIVACNYRCPSGPPQVNLCPNCARRHATRSHMTERDKTVDYF